MFKADSITWILQPNRSSLKSLSSPTQIALIAVMNENLEDTESEPSGPPDKVAPIKMRKRSGAIKNHRGST